MGVFDIALILRLAAIAMVMLIINTLLEEIGARKYSLIINLVAIIMMLFIVLDKIKVLFQVVKFFGI